MKMFHGRSVLLALSMLAACTGAPRVATTGGADSSSPEAVPAQAFHSPAAHEDDVSCLRAPAPGYSDPRTLANDYVRRDGAGEFTRGSTWIREAHYCPARLPGWDIFTLMSGVIIDSVIAHRSVATAFVTYRQLGSVWRDASGMAVLQEEPPDAPATLDMVRLADGWRITTVQRPHLLVATALALPTLNWSDSLRAVVERLARGAGTAAARDSATYGVLSNRP